eukprot:1483152-Pyramimonas_sp.AAC.1
MFGRSAGACAGAAQAGGGGHQAAALRVRLRGPLHGGGDARGVQRRGPQRAEGVQVYSQAGRRGERGALRKVKTAFETQGRGMCRLPTKDTKNDFLFWLPKRFLLAPP